MSVEKIVTKQYRDKVNQAVSQFGGFSVLPEEGWIRTVRKAFGMSGTQLAKKLGVTKARVSKAELDEPAGSVTLKTMYSMAEAMDCKFVYAIVPEHSVEEVVKQRAMQRAQAQVAVASTHMALEAQSLSREQLNFETERIAAQIMEQMPPDLWNTSLMDYPDGATPLDPDEMEGLKFEHVATRQELDQLEQAAITEGISWLRKQKTPEVLSEAFVCELHRQLFGAVWTWAGTFRRTEKNIGVDPYQIAIRLRQLLDDVAYCVEHNSYAPKELAARFHHQLVYIHLFPNGNGRHARIMADALLTKLLSEPAIDWAGGYSLESMNERRSDYIAALRAADGHDFRALLKFVGVKH